MHHRYHPSEYQDHRSSLLHIDEFDDDNSKDSKDDDNEISKDYPDDYEAANVEVDVIKVKVNVNVEAGSGHIPLSSSTCLRQEYTFI